MVRCEGNAACVPGADEYCEEELEVIAEKTPSNRKQDSEGAHELAARLFRAIAATVYFFVPVDGALY